MVISIKDANLKVVRQEEDDDVKHNQESKSLPKLTEVVAFDEKKTTKVVNESDEVEDDDWEGVEGTELDQKFDAATAFVATAAADRLLQKVPKDVELELYGLHKIATEGPCTTPQPSAINMTAGYKWNAWYKLGAMSSNDAMEKYITIVSEIYPAWISGSSVKRRDGDNEGNISKVPMGPVFCSFAYEEESDNELKMEAIHTSPREGELDNLVKHIGSGVVSMNWNGPKDLIYSVPREAHHFRRLQSFCGGTAMLAMFFDKFIAVGFESRLSRTTRYMAEDDVVAMQDGKEEDSEMEKVIIFPKNTPGFIKYGKEDYKKVRVVSEFSNAVMGTSGDRYMGVQLMKRLQDKLYRIETQGKKRLNTTQCAKFTAMCNYEMIEEKRIKDKYEVVIAGYDGRVPKIFTMGNKDKLSEYSYKDRQTEIVYAGCGGHNAAAFIRNEGWYQSDLQSSFVADRFCDALRHSEVEHPEDCGGLIRVYIITPKDVECVKYITEEQVREIGCVLPDGEDFQHEGYESDSSWCTDSSSYAE